MSERLPRDTKNDIEQAPDDDAELVPMTEGVRREYRAQLKHMVEKVLRERKEDPESPVA